MLGKHSPSELYPQPPKVDILKIRISSFTEVYIKIPGHNAVITWY
jgi:hypothetical protein